MVNNKVVRSLVVLLVAISFILFLLLAALSFNFSWGSYLFLVLLAVLVFLFFLFVFSRSKRKEKSEFHNFEKNPIVEYKSPAMEEFDKEYKKLKFENISEDEFIGTEESKMYHKLNCRFAKLIKPKYKVMGSRDFFKKKKFKACSVCKPNKI